MAEYAFADLLPEIIGDVPGVNELAVVRCARLATRYFCERTGFLTFEGAAQDIVAGQFTYDIPAEPNGRTIVNAVRVRVDGTDLVHRPAHQLDREQAAPRSMENWTIGIGNLTFNTASQPWRTAEEYPPHYYFQETPQSVRLVGIPNEDVAGALVINASVKPAQTHDSIDQSIIDNWYEVIVLGTKAEALRMPQKSWTDIANGTVMYQRFITATENALGGVISGFAANDHEVGRVRAYP